MSKPLLVREIAQIDRTTLGITWTDDHQSQWHLAQLRRRCPCAGCVDEWTGEPLLDPNKVDDQLVCSQIESVGRYALTIKFSDGHGTGIYTYTLLRELCQCAECEAKRS